jgi:hypothetical protein
MTQTLPGTDTSTRRPGWWSRRSAWQKWAIGISAPVLLFLIAISFFRQGEDPETLTFGEVLQLARDGRVDAIEVRGSTLDVRIRGDDREFRSRIGRSTDLTASLDRNQVAVGPGGVALEFNGPSPAGNWFGLLINVAIPLIFLFVMYFVVRNAVREGVRQGRRDDEHSASTSSASPR